MGEPDHYVWLRGYSDMQARLQALEAFYNSDYWFKRRALTNSMLIDSDNVHLLRLVSGDLTRGLNTQTVAMEFAAGTVSPETGIVAIDLYVAQAGKRDALLEALKTQVTPAYEHEGIDVRALCVTEMSENTFPRHPVIQIADLVVLFTVYASDKACEEQRSRVARHVAENAARCCGARRKRCCSARRCVHPCALRRAKVRQGQRNNH
ncbi:MAG: hypothetical protein U0694_16360 [Anaerolineae bacterium]